MAEPAEDWLADVSPRLRDPLSRCAAGLAPNVALMALLAEASGAGEAEEALRASISRLRSGGVSGGADRLSAALDLLRANPQAFDVVRSVLSGLDHRHKAGSGSAATIYWATAFDRLATRNPEAGVALYSLGNPNLLAAATREIADKLAEWGLLAPETECLDLGCGIGRFEQALAPHIRGLVGVDVSDGMVEAARRRCADLPNVAIRRTDGRELSEFPDRSFDLVLGVDSFPYIVQSGRELTEKMLAECARVLRPRGSLVILNFSYRGDRERDRRELQDFADGAALELLQGGASPFSLWDGAAFQLRKPAAAA